MMKESTVMRIPPGYVFKPTPQELLYCFLKKKLDDPNGYQNPYVHDIRIYDFHPKNILDNYGFLHHDEPVCYVFTQRNRRHRGGKRPNRVINGIGHWRASSTKEVLDDGGGSSNTNDSNIRQRSATVHASKKRKVVNNTVGIQQTLVFYEDKPGFKKGVKTDYLMYEYRIEGYHHQDDDDWVVCKIYRKSSNTTDVDEWNNNPQQQDDHLTINNSPLQVPEHDDDHYLEQHQHYQQVEVQGVGGNGDDLHNLQDEIMALLEWEVEDDERVGEEDGYLLDKLMVETAEKGEAAHTQQVDHHLQVIHNPHPELAASQHQKAVQPPHDHPTINISPLQVIHEHDNHYLEQQQQHYQQVEVQGVGNDDDLHNLHDELMAILEWEVGDDERVGEEDDYLHDKLMAETAEKGEAAPDQQVDHHLQVIHNPHPELAASQHQKAVQPPHDHPAINNSPLQVIPEHDDHYLEQQQQHYQQVEVQGGIGNADDLHNLHDELMAILEWEVEDDKRVGGEDDYLHDKLMAETTEKGEAAQDQQVDHYLQVIHNPHPELAVSQHQKAVQPPHDHPAINNSPLQVIPEHDNHYLEQQQQHYQQVEVQGGVGNDDDLHNLHDELMAILEWEVDDDEQVGEDNDNLHDKLMAEIAEKGQAAQDQQVDHHLQVIHNPHPELATSQHQEAVLPPHDQEEERHIDCDDNGTHDQHQQQLQLQQQQQEGNTTEQDDYSNKTFDEVLEEFYKEKLDIEERQQLQQQVMQHLPQLSSTSAVWQQQQRQQKPQQFGHEDPQNTFADIHEGIQKVLQRIDDAHPQEEPQSLQQQLDEGQQNYPSPEANYSSNINDASFYDYGNANIGVDITTNFYNYEDANIGDINDANFYYNYGHAY